MPRKLNALAYGLAFDPCADKHAELFEARKPSIPALIGPRIRRNRNFRPFHRAPGEIFSVPLCACRRLTVSGLRSAGIPIPKAGCGAMYGTYLPLYEGFEITSDQRP